MTLYSKIFGLTLIAVLAVIPHVCGQEIEDVDVAFAEARSLAFDGQRSAARQICRRILEINPEYHDVRIFMARTYGWENRFEPARRELNTVLEYSPRHLEALAALIDMEYWDDRPRRALEVADRALETYPTNSELLVKRARIYMLLGNHRDAVSDLNRADKMEPGMREVRELRRLIDVRQVSNRVTASVAYDYYTDDFEPWQQAYVEYQRQTAIGPLIGRVNAGNRFESTGVQFELDAYPQLIRRMYAYINIGYSESDIFPRFRAGGDIYRNFPGGWEASLGMRYLDFETVDIYIYTGSVSKYWRSWFFSLRPFVAPKDEDLSRSLVIYARRYFGIPETYITLTGGFGFSPEERRLTEAPEDALLVRSQNIGLNFYKLITDNLQLFTEGRVTNQEMQVIDDYIQIFTFQLGARVRF